MFYFAYGSNLDLMQMQLKCPDAQFVNSTRVVLTGVFDAPLDRARQ